MSAALSPGPGEPDDSGLPGKGGEGGDGQEEGWDGLEGDGWQTDQGMQQGLYVMAPAEDLSLEGFAQDGRTDTMAPGPLLAMILDTVAGPDGSGLDTMADDQLIGFLSGARRMAARLEWARMAALNEFASRHRGEDFAADEVPAAFRLDWLSAAGEIAYAQHVAKRLPVTFAALAAGKLDAVHVRIIADFTSVLSDEDAAIADAQLAAMARDKTYAQLRRAAARLVKKLDPGADRKRKEKARRETRVRAYREESGNAGITGREMPSVEALASMQHVEDRARALREAGVTGTWEELKVRAFLDLLQERDSRPAPGDSDPGGPSLGALITITVPHTALGDGGPGSHDGSGGGSGPGGEVDGFGLLDRADTRDLIAAAARDPATRWCLTTLNPDGTAATHDCAAGPRPWGPAHGPPGEQPGTPTRQGLMDLLNLTSLTPVIRGPCDHAGAEDHYRPSKKLQHRVRARNTTCTAPGCGRRAARCDLDHTTPTITAASAASATWRRSADTTIDASKPKAGGWHSPNPASWSGTLHPGARTPPPPPSTPPERARPRAAR